VNLQTNPPIPAGTAFGGARRFFKRRPVALFALILLIGLIPRLIMLPGAGFIVDQAQYHDWAVCAADNGLIGAYRCQPPPNYPPLIPALLGLSFGAFRALGGDTATSLADNPALLAALKLPGLLFETALIGLIFYIAYQKAGVWWAGLAAAVLYFNPGWMVITVWWGQTDAIYTALLLLAVFLLVRRHPRAMWIIFAVAMLAKFQTVVTLPILGLFSLRRFGWRATLVGGILATLVFVGGELLFFLGSGEAFLTPYRSSVNQFPYISNGGHNFWFLVSGAPATVLPDSLPLFGSVTYFQAGIALLALGTLIICLRVWLLPNRDDEYLVFALANFSFYMLPTQMGVRYFYPGVALLALAMLRDRRLFAVDIALVPFFTHNIFATVWLGIGLLYYPARLLFWSPVVDAVAMTVLYLVSMILLLQPLFRRKFVSLGREV
jgi:Gpi18-like mannosyltransferase